MLASIENAFASITGRIHKGVLHDKENSPTDLVIKKGKTVYNVFAEPQFSVADDGPGQPVWQIFVGFNMQFLN